jgi:hypothetical protein
MKLKHVTKEQLEEAVKNSLSARETARKLDLPLDGGTTGRVKKKAIRNAIDISHWTGQLWSKGKDGLADVRLRRTKTANDIFIENSAAGPSYVRELVRRNELIKYECQACSNKGEWFGEKLTLQLDHINGIRRDHRLENLRWLCPNCHSQTTTFCGKNVVRPTKTSDAELLVALENNKNIYQALREFGLENGRNYARAKRLLEKA